MLAVQVLTGISKPLTIVLRSIPLRLFSRIHPEPRPSLYASVQYRVRKEVRYGLAPLCIKHRFAHISFLQDTVRDVRGFAMKFYTEEGNWDLVGNDIPVFFIQDSVKFPDIVHAVKPEPHNEVPQGQSAHNNFWDFVGLQPESKGADAPTLGLLINRPSQAHIWLCG
jgi:hypothetical protein